MSQSRPEKKPPKGICRNCKTVKPLVPRRGVCLKCFSQGK